MANCQLYIFGCHIKEQKKKMILASFCRFNIIISIAENFKSWLTMKTNDRSLAYNSKKSFFLNLFRTS